MDILDRLCNRQVCSHAQNSCLNDSRCDEAVAEITRLRAALRDMASDAIDSDSQAADAYQAQLKAEAELDEARKKALEDAAKRVESLWAYRTCAEVAAAIRAMKGKP